MAMADARLSLLYVNDWVKTNDGRTCFIQSIENTIGYNVYILVDVDSGVTLRKSRYQIEPTTINISAVADDSAFAQLPDALPVEIKEEKKEETVQKRFASVSSDDLDQIELNRSSIRTKRQTSWAVGILKGERYCNEWDFMNETTLDTNIRLKINWF